MKTISINLDNFISPKDIIKKFDEEGLEKGDTISINKGIPFLIIISLLIMSVIVYFRKKQRIDEGEKILNDIFEKYDNEDELFTEIKEVYGIDIETEQRKIETQERNFWTKLNLQNLNRAYQEDEEDYTDVPVLETNPNFINEKR